MNRLIRENAVEKKKSGFHLIKRKCIYELFRMPYYWRKHVSQREGSLWISSHLRKIEVPFITCLEENLTRGNTAKCAIIWKRGRESWGFSWESTNGETWACMNMRFLNSVFIMIISYLKCALACDFGCPTWRRPFENLNASFASICGAYTCASYDLSREYRLK